MDIELVNTVKRLAIIALASDDELVESLVLKGGNAIELEFINNPRKLSRSSYDLDYSIQGGDFTEDESEISARIEKTLVQTFLENDFHVFDYKFEVRPHVIKGPHAIFWGGYNVLFKVISLDEFSKTGSDLRKLRNNAIVLNPNQSPTFTLEFSKFEYVGEKKSVDVDGFNVYIYTPEMIVFEKLRAICQQDKEYKTIIPQFTPRPRARDFYDIHLIMDIHDINPTSHESLKLIENIFHAKRVPLNFIKNIRDNKDIHIDNWKTVVATVSAEDEIKDFDFYFNFVLDKFENITFPSDNTTSI